MSVRVHHTSFFDKQVGTAIEIHLFQIIKYSRMPSKRRGAKYEMKECYLGNKLERKEKIYFFHAKDRIL